MEASILIMPYYKEDFIIFPFASEHTIFVVLYTRINRHMSNLSSFSINILKY